MFSESTRKKIIADRIARIKAGQEKSRVILKTQRESKYKQYHILHDTPKMIEALVDKKSVHECWPYMKGTTNKYGRVYFRGKAFAAHRLAYLNYYGTLLDTDVIMHLCNNPICCNPHHLYAGTHRENMQHRLITEHEKYSKLLDEFL